MTGSARFRVACNALLAGLSALGMAVPARGVALPQTRANATPQAPQNPARLVALDVRAEPARAWVGQVVTIDFELRLAKPAFRKSAIQLHRQKLGVPVEIEAAWLRGLKGARALGDGPPDPAARLATIAIGGTRSTARRVDESSDAWERYIVSRRFVLEEAGRLKLEAARARFAYATSFEVDLFGDRRPVDRKIAHVDARPLEVVAHALPTEGRPASFRGAVGSFSLEVAVTRGEATAEGHELCQIDLEVVGEGEVARALVPQLANGYGVHVRGQRVTRTETGARARSEVEILNDAQAGFPPVELAFFDPASGVYRIARTSAIVLAGDARNATPSTDAGTKAPPTKGGGASDAAKPENPEKPRDALDAAPVFRSAQELLDAARATPARASTARFPWLLALGLLGPALVFACLVGRRAARRARRRRALDPATMARAVLREERSDVRRLESRFCAYLARRLEAASSELHTPEVAAALVAVGVSTDNAERTRRCLRALAATRYSAPASPSRDPGAAELGASVQELVRKLEAERCA